MCLNSGKGWTWGKPYTCQSWVLFLLTTYFVTVSLSPLGLISPNQVFPMSYSAFIMFGIGHVGKRFRG